MTVAEAKLRLRLALLEARQEASRQLGASLGRTLLTAAGVGAVLGLRPAMRSTVLAVMDWLVGGPSTASPAATDAAQSDDRGGQFD